MVRVIYQLFSGFSRELAYLHYHFVHARSVLSGSTRSADLPTNQLSTPFNQLFRQSAVVSLLRLHITQYISTGILTSSSIGIAIRLILRPRLTLIRLALIRKPWSCGVRVTLPHYRYSCLHLLFHTLHQTSRFGFNAEWNAPLPHFRAQNFGGILDARLLSTLCRSTSELLRTL